MPDFDDVPDDTAGERTPTRPILPEDRPIVAACIQAAATALVGNPNILTPNDPDQIIELAKLLHAAAFKAGWTAPPS